MRAIIVDDEPLALEVLEKELRNFPEVKIIDCFTDPRKALDFARDQKPDVIFLDIEMGIFNGIELNEPFMECSPNSMIVFVTAYSKYAVEAFEVNAIDYLLKPVQTKRLGKTIKRIGEERKAKEKSDLSGSDLYIESFGSFLVRDSLDRALSWRTQKTKELFAFLWLQDGRPVSKSIIIETIFPDRDLERGKTILHTTIYQLRKSLSKLGLGKAIVYKNESYHLDLEIKSDKEVLDEFIDGEKVDKDAVMGIISLYKGAFFDHEAYSWVMDQQERYREKVYSILESYILEGISSDLADHEEKELLDTLINIDPYREFAALKMIDYYGKRNMIHRLRNFYSDYRELIRDETDLEPGVVLEERYRLYVS